MITELSFSFFIAVLFLMVMSSNAFTQDSTAIWYQIGTEYFNKKDYAKAVLYLTKYLEKDKRDVDANYRRGVSLYRLQLYREALKTFRLLRDSVCDRSSPFYTRNKFSIRGWEKERDDARKCDSLFIPINMYKGNCHFRMGNYILAWMTWTNVKVLAKGPVVDPETGASLEVLEAASAKMMNSQIKGK